jgi:hypothetical protein
MIGGRVFVDPDGKPIGVEFDKHMHGVLKGWIKTLTTNILLTLIIKAIA